MILILFLLVLSQGIQGFASQIPLVVSKVETIPPLGFGTWNLDKAKAPESVSFALQVGYRHIDCAAVYGNQKEVGKGIQHGLLKAGISRESIWVTSKLWNDRYGFESIFSVCI